jgi:bifunctional UDP-N-acetylglucosamine pyrophosphorylase/glucosamine-1-phosphate N-acetyltransferase
MARCAGVVLAAGLGTRMRSKLPKVCHLAAGRPLVAYPLSALKAADAEPLVAVLGHGADQVRPALLPGVKTVLQSRPLGTGHALASVEKALKGFRGTLLVAGGDTPLLSAASLKGLLAAHRRGGHAVTVMTAVLDRPEGYGRILRSRTGELLGIVEQREASPRQAALREVNAGVYCFEAPVIWAVLKGLRNDNAKGEYYLTDALAALRGSGGRCGSFVCQDPSEILGVNTREELSQAEAALRRRASRRLMASGVTLVDPASTFIDDTVMVGRDTVIQPFSFLTGRTRVGEDCLVGPFARIQDSILESGCQVVQSVVQASRVGRKATVGPWSHLRPGTEVGAEAHLGAFCEFKKTRLGRGVRAAHLSYLGDARIGAGANIGAGTITANYDGRNKFPTVLGPGAFTGSGTVLVAPVKMGKGSKTGAGAIVLAGRDVPAGSLAVGVPARILRGRKTEDGRRRSKK